MDKEVGSSSDSGQEDSRLLSPTSNASTFNDECDDEPTQYYSHSKRTSHLKPIILTVIITLLTTTAFQQLYHQLTFSQEQTIKAAIATLYSEEARLTPRHHCGNSSTEALAHGCIFDLSVGGWIPSACHDPDLAQRFLDFGLRVFEDQAGIREVSLERLAASAGQDEFFWVPHGFHVVHCELAWERMHRSLRDGKTRLTTHLMNLGHTRHCGKYQEIRIPLEEINSRFVPILNTC